MLTEGLLAVAVVILFCLLIKHQGKSLPVWVDVGEGRAVAVACDWNAFSLSLDDVTE